MYIFIYICVCVLKIKYKVNRNMSAIFLFIVGAIKNCLQDYHSENTNSCVRYFPQTNMKTTAHNLLYTKKYRKYININI